jgi:rod shape-determining protein MreB
VSSLINRILGAFSTDLAIDLGTANTLVYATGRGILFNEPSVVAVDPSRSRVFAVGAEAKEMIGRTPGTILAVRPLKDGVIADFTTAEAMLRYFIQKAHSRTRLVRPRMVIGVPSGITEVERRAVRESAMLAGAREVYLLSEPMAAAIGAGLPVEEPSGNMIVDIGGGTTEVAVIALAGTVYAHSLRIGGDRMDEAILQYVKRKFNLLIGERTAEAIKLELGSAFPSGESPKYMTVKGRDLVAGIPKTLRISEDDVREALAEPVQAIAEAVHAALECTPPELAADICDNGVVLSGGGAKLRNLDHFLQNEMKLPVVIAENPLEAVVIGCGRCLDHADLLHQVAARG